MKGRKWDGNPDISLRPLFDHVPPVEFSQADRIGPRSSASSRRRLLRQIFGDGFAAGVDVEFAVNAFDVHSDGIDADGEDVGDFLVGNALGKAIENFFLSS